MITKRRFLSLAGTAGLACALPGMSEPAQSHVVSSPARMLVGFPPGSSIDLVARLLVNEMKNYSTSFVVDNRPGAGGRIALEVLKGSAADASVMILSPMGAITLYPHVYKTLGYNASKDFAPVTTVCSFLHLLTVGPRVPAAVKTLADFIAWCRANPNEANYATAGAGSPGHFIGVMLSRAAGFEFVHVPYSGAGAVSLMQDLLAGEVAASVYPTGVMLAHVQSGRLRALAITGRQRGAWLPDVPTVRELGYPQLEVTDGMDILVPAKTPAEIVNGLNLAIREALKKDAVKAGLATLAYEAAGASPSDSANLIKADFDRWGPIVRASGFTPAD